MNKARKTAVATGEADSVIGDLMKAIVQDRFGPPDTLHLMDTEKPEIGSGTYFSPCTPQRSTLTTGTWSAVTRVSLASWAASD